MKNNRRQDVTVEIVVGAFVFAVFLVLAFFSIAISKNSLLRETYPLTVWFPDVGGLKDGENVLMRGLKVGIVKRIRLSSSDRGGVDVELQLDRPVQLHEDYRIESVSSSMLGGMRVVIHEGTAGKGLVNISGPVDGHTPPDLMSSAGKLLDDIDTALTEGEILANFKTTLANIRVISDKIANGTGLIARIIAEDGLYRDAQDLIRDVDLAAEDLAAITADVRAGKGLLGALITDTNHVYAKIDSVVSNANVVASNLASVSTRLEKGEGTLGKLLSSDDTLYKDLQSAIAGIREATDNFKNKDGTIGKLFAEDTLYQEVRQLIQDARATVDDFRETSPITTFSSIFFGAL